MAVVYHKAKKRMKCMFGKDRDPVREPYFTNMGECLITTSDGDSGTGGETWYTYTINQEAWLDND